MSVTLPINVSTRRMAAVTCTAGQTAIPYNFPLLRQEDIRVTRTRAGVTAELVIGTDFTVSGVGNANGGTVTLTVGATAGDIIVVDGDAVISRLSSIIQSGRFSSAQIDLELDLAVIRDQELRRDVDVLAAAPAFATLQESVEDIIGASLMAGPGISLVYDDNTGKVTLTNIGVPNGGSGNVVGPASSVNGNVARFSGTTGKVLVDGGAITPSMLSTGALAWDANGYHTFGFPYRLDTGSLDFYPIQIAGWPGYGDGGGIALIQHSNDQSCSALTGYKTRGTTYNSVTAIQTGDEIVEISGEAANGTTYVKTGYITLRTTDQAPISGSIIPSTWNFGSMTTSGTLNLQMQLTHNADLYLAGGIKAGTGYTNNGVNQYDFYYGSKVFGYSASGNAVVGHADASGQAAKVSSVKVTGADLHAFFFSPNGPFNSTGAVKTGAITTNGTTTTYGTSSDYRLKEDVEPMADALATVAALKPVTWKWKSNGAAGQGFIAHELQEIVPDCVSGEKDAVMPVGRIVSAAGAVIADNVGCPEILEEGQQWQHTEDRPIYQNVDPAFLVATLTKALQELAASVTALELKVEAYKNSQA